MDPLTQRLRSADGFTTLAAAIIDELGALPNVRGVAVEAHDAEGPYVWLGTPAFDPATAQRYLDGERDELVARVRVTLAPLHDNTTWLCPIVGLGELLGMVRVLVDAPYNFAPLLHRVSTSVSVRLAQLGGLACETLGAAVLTPRQHEVVVLVARGATNREIADLLDISSNAVKKHLSRAFGLLEVSNRTELAAIASQWSYTPSTAIGPNIRVLRRPCVSKHFGTRRRAA